MSDNFKQRLTLPGLGFGQSAAIWSAAALFFISAVLAAWASVYHHGGPGNGAQSPDTGNPTPTSTPASSLPTPTPQAPAVSAADALTPFFSSDGPGIALLVQSPGALTDVESQWLSDIRDQLGPAEAVSYSSVTAESIAGYVTIFVIDDSDDLDVSALAAAAADGASVHLVGDAAAYATQVIPGGDS